MDNRTTIATVAPVPGRSLDIDSVRVAFEAEGWRNVKVMIVKNGLTKPIEYDVTADADSNPYA